MSRDDIHDVYAEAKERGAGALYRDWAAEYDVDSAKLGIRLPGVAAALAARHIPRGRGPILDAGAGTGAVGETLSILGYDGIAAVDISPEMLEIAAGTGAYAELGQSDLSASLPFEDARFAGALCVGSFGPGHAPPTALRELARVTRPGGAVIFNLVERTWREQGFPAVLDDLAERGVWEEVERTKPFRVYTIGEPDHLTILFAFRRLQPPG